MHRVYNFQITTLRSKAKACRRIAGAVEAIGATEAADDLRTAATLMDELAAPLDELAKQQSAEAEASKGSIPVSAG
jgi:hypothetical protein